MVVTKITRLVLGGNSTNVQIRIVQISLRIHQNNTTMDILVTKVNPAHISKYLYHLYKKFKLTRIANKRILILVPDCPWLSPTDHINLLQCVDGSFCNAWTDSAGWSCCKEHGGRAKCPKNLPLMCAAEKGCAEGSDHCCEKECSSYGGRRKCGTLSKIF